MTALKARDVDGFAARPDLARGVILVYGPDGGLVREVANRLVVHYGGGGNGVVALDGEVLERDPGQILVEAQTMSLFGDRRVVRVRGGGKALAAPLAVLIDDPGETVIVIEAGNLLPRDALRALVEGAPNGRALPCYPDDDAAVGRLVAQGFAAAGIAVDPDVSELLREILGSDREVTRREIEKLVLFADEGKSVSRADVLALCADNAMLALDDVADAIGSGHAERLDTALVRALAAAVNPQQLLAAMAAHFLTLRRWRTAMDAEGLSPRAMLERTRPRPHFSRLAALEQQLRLWSGADLARAQERLLEATALSRKHHGRAEVLTRRVFLALAQMAALH